MIRLSCINSLHDEFDSYKIKDLTQFKISHDVVHNVNVKEAFKSLLNAFVVWSQNGFKARHERDVN